MAGWISSKLKVAENLLQQIDQQAAESLRHGEGKPSDELDFSATPKLSSSVSLKDQLKKKAAASNNNENFVKLSSDYSGNDVAGNVIRSGPSGSKQKRDSDSKSPSTINDGDWTELLSSPIQPVAQSSRAPAGTRGARSGVLRAGMNANALGRGRKRRDGNGGKANTNVGFGGSGVQAPLKSGSTSSVSKIGEEGRGRDHDCNDIVAGQKSVVKVGDDPGAIDETNENVSVKVSTDGKGSAVDNEKVGHETLTMSNHNGDVAFHDSGKPKATFRDPESDSDSDSGSESSSTSNSEVEREREERIQRRREILAARAALKVLEAIKQQENVVAQLEGEKQSLEKILEERAKKAAQEASELQSMMMETMEAADLEKQKHNHTRMEVLARLAKFETSNADLAKSLAAAQWNLELEVNNVAELRRLVDAKELAHEELKRHICSTHQMRNSQASLMPSKGLALEREILEGEYTFITEKVALLQEKATKLSEDVDVVLKEMERPTEVEVEIKRRLSQMTDHLIQKQAQVEALSSEKATLLFRNEAVLRLLDENKSLTEGGYMSGSSREDLEGTCESGSPNLRMLEDKIQSGKQHLGSLVHQLDVVFHAGAVFLARNPAAKSWSLVYLVCVHLWVLYILFSHSQSTENSISSSVISLENINNNIGG